MAKNKFLKILFAIEIILISIIIALSLIDNKQIPTAYVVKEDVSTKNTDFRIFTKAVCEESSDHLFCRDKLFVKCNENEYIIDDNNLNNFTKCNNLKLNLSDYKVNGSGMFKRR